MNLDSDDPPPEPGKRVVSLPGSERPTPLRPDPPRTTERLPAESMEGACNAALTVLQTIKPEGIIVVTTPQDMVTNIAHHSQDMADAIGTEVIGLVMNMAYVVCPHCPERIDVFGTLTEAPEGGPAQLATRPLVPDWAALADGGRTADAATEEFDALAERVLSEIGVELTDA